MAGQEAPGTNGHTPVSNVPEAGEVVAEEQISQPSEGEASEEVQGERDGVETVAGHERTEAALARRFTAPDTSALRPIAEASFGPPPPLAEIVHGPDDRVQITNTSIYPWRVHASLLITAADNSLWIGTGWFIGPHTLMTAGHVVFINGSGVPGRDGWVRSIQVMPGRNGGSLPYGSVTSTSFRSVLGWTNSADQNYDYGAIIIPTELGNTTGWFGFGVWSDGDLTAVTANIAGYPGDKQVASVDARKVYYDIDTAGGQSGSAVYRFYNGGRYGIAIHAYGGAVTNNGTRIVSPVFTNMLAWKA